MRNLCGPLISNCFNRSSHEVGAENQPAQIRTSQQSGNQNLSNIQAVTEVPAATRKNYPHCIQVALQKILRRTMTPNEPFSPDTTVAGAAAVATTTVTTEPTTAQALPGSPADIPLEPVTSATLLNQEALDELEIADLPTFEVNSLPSDEKEKFLEKHDPVRTLGISDEDFVYRVLRGKYLKNREDGTLAIEGNPQSFARIKNHLLARKPPIMTIQTTQYSWSTEDSTPSSSFHMDSSVGSGSGFLPRYIPVDMYARDLHDPTLIDSAR